MGLQSNIELPCNSKRQNIFKHLWIQISICKRKTQKGRVYQAELCICIYWLLHRTGWGVGQGGEQRILFSLKHWKQEFQMPIMKNPIKYYSISVTLTDFLAYFSKAAPWDLKIFTFALSKSFLSMPSLLGMEPTRTAISRSLKATSSLSVAMTSASNMAEILKHQSSFSYWIYPVTPSPCSKCLLLHYHIDKKSQECKRQIMNSTLTWAEVSVYSAFPISVIISISKILCLLSFIIS